MYIEDYYGYKGAKYSRAVDAADDGLDRIGRPSIWGHARYTDKSASNVLIGEHKDPKGKVARALFSIMVRGLPEDFFANVVNQKQSPGNGDDERWVARILSRLYHYMISTGIGFTYVTTGIHVLFLSVPKDNWRTLYYHWCDFSVPSYRNVNIRKMMNKGLRAPHETAAAYFTSFCLLAVQAGPRSASWINAAEGDLRYWPATYAKEDDGSVGSSLKLAKKPPVPMPWKMRYCTQACLRGMQLQESLDDKCPNFGLHREAAHRHGHRKHPLTVEEVAKLVTGQLAVSPDQDCECLDKYGMYGRHGVMFKITLTGYGYTFVGKAVRASDREVLEQEETIYNKAHKVQGRLVPVFLGVIDLENSIPLHSYVLVSHMMLLSYAGVDVYAATQANTLPAGIDTKAEEKRTWDELYKEGVNNVKARSPNMAWNAEVGRMMHFDLYRAELVPCSKKEKNEEYRKELLEFQRQLSSKMEAKQLKSAKRKLGDFPSGDYPAIEDEMSNNDDTRKRAKTTGTHWELVGLGNTDC